MHNVQSVYSLDNVQAIQIQAHEFFVMLDLWLMTTETLTHEKLVLGNVFEQVTQPVFTITHQTLNVDEEV